MPSRTSHRSRMAASPFVGVAARLLALTACLSGPSGYIHADDRPLAPGDVILLDFGASWCGPCRQMQPVIGDLSRSGWLVRHVDVDVEPDLVRRFGITGVPCYVLLVRGEEKGRIGGVTTRSALESLMRRSIPTASEPLAAANSSAAVPEVAIPGVPRAATPVARALVTEPSRPGEGLTTGGGVSNRPPLEPATIVNTQASPQRGPIATTVPLNESVATLVDDQAARRLLATSARLRVEDGKGASWGTGTVIDCRQGEALILTCGHIFRDSAGGGRVEVDLCGSPAA
ncbi:MAG: thioredoxin family protein [Planctomycetaceae bacterium]